MEAEEVISLLDSYWFGGQKNFKKYSKQTSPLEDDHLKFQEKETSKQGILSQLLLSRSLSDHLMISNNKTISSDSDSQSPDSVMYSSKRRSISSNSEEQQLVVVPRRRTPQERKTSSFLLSSSKSLSELEYKELKGFMDLGFIFSEEDKKSSLVDIIPGLQRIGKQHEQEEQMSCGGKCSISRPYLSEAWKDDLDSTRIKRRGGMNQLLMKKWRIPSPGNENDMKDNLKWWAHTVAVASSGFLGHHDN